MWITQISLMQAVSKTAKITLFPSYGTIMPQPSAQQILHEVFGYPEFRGKQEAVVNTLAGGGSLLVLMPTGGGKSLCYQIPALMREGVAIVVSPLIALMNDQVASLHAAGIEAAAVNSSTTVEEAREVADKLAQGRLKLLYVAPERLVTDRFLRFLDQQTISLFRHRRSALRQPMGTRFPPRIPAIRAACRTLSASAAHCPDCDRRCGDPRRYQTFPPLEDAPEFISSFDRPNIYYQVIEKNNGKKQLLDFIRKEMEGQSGIVYCLSRKKVEDIAQFLCENGLDAIPYHAGLSMEVREANQRRFTREDNIIVVATVAFGMGIDKPDVRFVAHLDMPQSVEHFYQESGRAGRDGLPAVSWLCYGLNDWVLLRERIAEGNSDEVQKQIEMQKLDAMLSVCETAACRRVLLLKHFGEESAPCGHCDNCLHPPVRFDGTVLVQKLLSCVYRAGQRFAAGYIINLLRGKSDDWIRRNGHDKLSTFGIGSGQTDKEWRSVIRQCISLGYLTVNIAQYQALQLTEAAKKVLKGETEVMLRPLRREKAATQKPKDNWLRTEREERLWQALRHWRQQRAHAEEVPAYVVCGNKTLRDIVEKIPQTLGDLHQIYGLGEAKINKFGIDILKVCENAAENQSGQTGNEEPLFTPQTEREQQLQQKLETWRAEQAAAKQCALGKVLSNISLTDLVVFTPAEEADLLGIYGIGSERIAQYGQAILDICRPYADGLSEPKQAERLLARRLFQWCLDTARYEGGEMHAVAKKTDFTRHRQSPAANLDGAFQNRGRERGMVGPIRRRIVEICTAD